MSPQAYGIWSVYDGYGLHLCPDWAWAVVSRALISIPSCEIARGIAGKQRSNEQLRFDVRIASAAEACWLPHSWS